MPRRSAWESSLCVTQRGRDACGQVCATSLRFSGLTAVTFCTPCKSLIVTGQGFASAFCFPQSPHVLYSYSLYILFYFFSCFGNVSVLMGWSLWCTHLGQVPPSCWYGGSSTGCFNFNVFVSCWKGSSSLLTRLLFTIFLLFLEVLS